MSGPPDHTGLDVVLTPIPSVAGTATDSVSHAPLSGIAVTATPSTPGGTALTATTDAAGHYAFADVALGSYLLAFTDPAGVRITEYYGGGVYTATAATPVPVTLAAPWATVDAALDQPGSISGSITGAGGNKDRACVQAWTDATTKAGAGVCVAGGGAYSLTGLLPGTYRVSVTQKNGQTTWYAAATTYATATPVVVGSGAKVTGIDISVKGKPKS